MSNILNHSTRELIKRFSPMWTNMQVWEFDQLNWDLKFDMAYVESNQRPESRDSKMSYPDSDIRDVTVQTSEHLLDGYDLWIADRIHGKMSERVPYLMAVMVDLMIDEEFCINFRMDGDYLIVSRDESADIIDCKEFFEEFYHLAAGFNYDIDTGIPDDETEAEIYITRLQEEFDEKMKQKLGDKYLPGNKDPDMMHEGDI